MHQNNPDLSYNQLNAHIGIIVVKFKFKNAQIYYDPLIFPQQQRVGYFTKLPKFCQIYTIKASSMLQTKEIMDKMYLEKKKNGKNQCERAMHVMYKN